MDTSQYKVHSDLPGHETSNGGSLPPSMVVTNLKPDIVIIDDKKKEAKLFELTCPIEHNKNTNLTNMHISKLTLKLTKPRYVPLKLAQEVLLQMKTLPGYHHSTSI